MQTTNTLQCRHSPPEVTPMSNSANVDDDDEYIAKLLAEDARKSSLRYASAGTYGLTPRRPPNAGPKPNTRFLKTLVREVDSHNAALKKKEELEARMRLRRLQEGPGRDTDKSNSTGGGDDDSHSRRRHQHHHRRKSSGERYRRRTSPDGAEDHDRRRRHRHSRHEDDKRERNRRRSRSPADRDRDHDLDDEREHGHGHSHARRRTRRRHGDDESPDDGSRQRRRRRTSPSRSVSRERADTHHKKGPAQLESTEKDHQNHERHLRPNPSHSENTHQEGCSREKKTITDTDTPQHQRRHRHRRRSTSSNSSSSSTSTSSDPLSSLIGPLPRSKDDTSNSITRRGRGFTRHQRHPPTSNIDAHFSTGYDPTQDVDVGGPYESPPDDPNQENGADDWDNALEALRDRRAWQAKQADRMREAGFDDDEIERWKASASTRTGTGDADLDLDIRHVKWRKKGEGREWDAGKVQDQD
ncbi:hypothetical protein HRR80_005207 [Exophiala dermatitidis]|nr:hypothetical protein HRR77_008687 [Exophiala dermatitidis]KAJ4545024.1 hypothetical protein HRR76_003056 [Exophiala dermatitidis]KAJ4555017.1 hypothetical protein HRR79_009128 [Exophiala dermatitidis]KAJ4582040.1 hypothetical protein HRR82_003941 [Exophiala dermatitidis]KAJ4611865.1 hypothetical protein HRR85_004694 [Exophiala dermatitidis]